MRNPDVLHHRPAADAAGRLHRAAALRGVGWNNPFLPLAMISDQTLLSVTVGLNAWQVQSNSATANGLIWNLVTSGSLVTSYRSSSPS
ncbi:hypothetical protein [Arthrobacter gengyunqii]|uniref:Uncharacterized protein n=1 Tax=Arthrobacter gengyunqii TaxID=2886940 RepID=A0ABS8GJY0_9MICC|nr:hypothetical protein [Arthrobacter gengyunqii]MCC3266920.1 hypothetical protein [Arthrobacter gengyunqii]